VLVPRRTNLYGPDLLTDRTVRYVQLRNYARRRGLLTATTDVSSGAAQPHAFFDKAVNFRLRNQ
jgi:hypothetical protein